MALPVQEMFNRGALISPCFPSALFLNTYHVLGINSEVSKDGPWSQAVLSAVRDRYMETTDLPTKQSETSTERRFGQHSLRKQRSVVSKPASLLQVRSISYPRGQQERK